MDEESFKRFYPEEWAKQQEVNGPADTSTQIVNPRDILLERFIERMLQEHKTEEQVKLIEEYKGLSNLKKDMVRRKVRKIKHKEAYTNANNIMVKKKRRKQREAKVNAANTRTTEEIT